MPYDGSKRSKLDRARDAETEKRRLDELERERFAKTNNNKKKKSPSTATTSPRKRNSPSAATSPAVTALKIQGDAKKQQQDESVDDHNKMDADFVVQNKKKIQADANNSAPAVPPFPRTGEATKNLNNNTNAKKNNNSATTAAIMAEVAAKPAVSTVTSPNVASGGLLPDARILPPRVSSTQNPGYPSSKPIFPSHTATPTKNTNNGDTSNDHNNNNNHILPSGLRISENNNYHNNNNQQSNKSSGAEYNTNANYSSSPCVNRNSALAAGGPLAEFSTTNPFTKIFTNNNNTDAGNNNKVMTTAVDLHSLHTHQDSIQNGSANMMGSEMIANRFPLSGAAVAVDILTNNKNNNNLGNNLKKFSVGTTVEFKSKDTQFLNASPQRMHGGGGNHKGKGNNGNYYNTLTTNGTSNDAGPSSLVNATSNNNNDDDEIGGDEVNKLKKLRKTRTPNNASDTLVPGAPRSSSKSQHRDEKEVHGETKSSVGLPSRALGNRNNDDDDFTDAPSNLPNQNTAVHISPSHKIEQKGGSSDSSKNSSDKKNNNNNSNNENCSPKQESNLLVLNAKGQNFPNARVSSCNMMNSNNNNNNSNAANIGVASMGKLTLTNVCASGALPTDNSETKIPQTADVSVDDGTNRTLSVATNHNIISNKLMNLHGFALASGKIPDFSSSAMMNSNFSTAAIKKATAALLQQQQQNNNNNNNATNKSSGMENTTKKIGNENNNNNNNNDDDDNATTNPTEGENHHHHHLHHHTNNTQNHKVNEFNFRDTQEGINKINQQTTSNQKKAETPTTRRKSTKSQLLDDNNENNHNAGVLSTVPPVLAQKIPLEASSSTSSKKSAKPSPSSSAENLSGSGGDRMFRESSSTRRREQKRKNTKFNEDDDDSSADNDDDVGKKLLSDAGVVAAVDDGHHMGRGGNQQQQHRTKNIISYTSIGVAAIDEKNNANPEIATNNNNHNNIFVPERGQPRSTLQTMNSLSVTPFNRSPQLLPGQPPIAAAALTNTGDYLNNNNNNNNNNNPFVLTPGNDNNNNNLEHHHNHHHHNHNHNRRNSNPQNNNSTKNSKSTNNNNNTTNDDDNEKIVVPPPHNVGAKDTENFVLSNCAHPNIVGYVDSFVSGNDLYLVMEYVDGGTLANIIDERDNGVARSFPLKKLQQYFVQMILGLEYLHRHSMMHRDLKPSNLLVSQTGLLKLADFGFAKQYDNLNFSATCLGTVLYMSPEQLQGKAYTAKADMWAAGVILYQLLHLELPWSGAKRSEDLLPMIEEQQKAWNNLAPGQNNHNNHHATALPSATRHANNRSVSNFFNRSVRGDMIDPTMMSIVKKLLKMHPDERLSAKQVLEIPAMRTALEDYVGKVAQLAATSDSELDKVWADVLMDHVKLLKEHAGPMTSVESRFLCADQARRQMARRALEQRYLLRYGEPYVPKKLRKSSATSNNNHNINTNNANSSTSAEVTNRNSSQPQPSQQQQQQQQSQLDPHKNRSSTTKDTKPQAFATLTTTADTNPTRTNILLHGEVAVGTNSASSFEMMINHNNNNNSVKKNNLEQQQQQQVKNTATITKFSPRLQQQQIQSDSVVSDNFTGECSSPENFLKHNNRNVKNAKNNNNDTGATAAPAEPGEAEDVIMELLFKKQHNPQQQQQHPREESAVLTNALIRVIPVSATNNHDLLLTSQSASHNHRIQDEQQEQQQQQTQQQQQQTQQQTQQQSCFGSNVNTNSNRNQISEFRTTTTTTSHRDGGENNDDDDDGDNDEQRQRMFPKQHHRAEADYHI